MSVMSSLLDKIESLIHNWFPNKADDRTNFEEWYDEMVHFVDGELIIGVLTPQTKSNVNVARECRRVTNQIYLAKVTVSKGELLPSPSNNNQQIQVKVGDGTILPSSSDIYELYLTTQGNMCPTIESFDVHITISPYYEDGVYYQGLEYIITVPRISNYSTPLMTINVQQV